MKIYKKIFLISDIHGKFNIIDNHQHLFTPTTPLFILGDLFDRNFGFGKQLLKYVSDNLHTESLHFISGNHDQMLFFSLIEQFPTSDAESEELINILLLASQNSTTQTIADIFGAEIADLVHQQIREFPRLVKKFNYTYTQVIQNYYTFINQGLEEHFSKIKEQLHQLHNLYNYQEFSIGVQIQDRRILLTHSGVSNDTWSLQGLSQDYQPDPNYDFTVMGHITFNMINSILNQVESPIAIEDIFSSNYSLYDSQTLFRLDITGEFKYINENRLFLIDDGSYENLITIS